MKQVILALALVLGLVTPAYANHERSRCYDECDGGGYGDGDNSRQDYDQWRNEDRNRNRNRNRGAFSPGPFDDSPVDAFNGNTICLPGSYCTPPEDRNPPPDQRPSADPNPACLVPFPYHCDPHP